MKTITPPELTSLQADWHGETERRLGGDFSDVRAQQSSNVPARLQAIAYTQGNDIHLSPGAERHLPHEAWHVVQQASPRTWERPR